MFGFLQYLNFVLVSFSEEEIGSGGIGCNWLLDGGQDNALPKEN
jgi:hypothetical protein